MFFTTNYSTKNVKCQMGDKKVKNSRGFTLIETMIAIIILGITALGGIFFLFSSSQFVTDFESDLKGVNLAKETMERFTWRMPQDWIEESGEDPVPGAGNFGSFVNAARRYQIEDKGSYKLLEVSVEISEEE